MVSGTAQHTLGEHDGWKARLTAAPDAHLYLPLSRRFPEICPVVSLGPRGHVSHQAQGSAYTTRAMSQNWTGSRQYGQIFILAVQRSHAS